MLATCVSWGSVGRDTAGSVVVEGAVGSGTEVVDGGGSSNPIAVPVADPVGESAPHDAANSTHTSSAGTRREKGIDSIVGTHRHVVIAT
jgi:hypothetical protein